MYTCHITLAADNFPERETRLGNKVLGEDTTGYYGRRGVTEGTRKFASAPAIWVQRLSGIMVRWVELLPFSIHVYRSFSRDVITF